MGQQQGKDLPPDEDLIRGLATSLPSYIEKIETERRRFKHFEQKLLGNIDRSALYEAAEGVVTLKSHDDFDNPCENLKLCSSLLGTVTIVCYFYFDFLTSILMTVLVVCCIVDYVAVIVIERHHMTAEAIMSNRFTLRARYNEAEHRYEVWSSFLFSFKCLRRVLTTFISTVNDNFYDVECSSPGRSNFYRRIRHLDVYIRDDMEEFFKAFLDFMKNKEAAENIFLAIAKSSSKDFTSTKLYTTLEHSIPIFLENIKLYYGSLSQKDFES